MHLFHQNPLHAQQTPYVEVMSKEASNVVVNFMIPRTGAVVIPGSRGVGIKCLYIVKIP
jgi:hypothetical protein